MIWSITFTCSINCFSNFASTWFWWSAIFSETEDFALLVGLVGVITKEGVAVNVGVDEIVVVVEVGIFDVVTVGVEDEAVEAVDDPVEAGDEGVGTEDEVGAEDEALRVVVDAIAGAEVALAVAEDETSELGGPGDEVAGGIEGEGVEVAGDTGTGEGDGVGDEVGAAEDEVAAEGDGVAGAGGGVAGTGAVVEVGVAEIEADGVVVGGGAACTEKAAAAAVKAERGGEFCFRIARISWHRRIWGRYSRSKRYSVA
jgi:hypothetical protein